MGFLDSIKHTFNIGGAEVRVEVEDDVYSQGDRVNGTVHITGGDYAQAGDTVTLWLKEYWTETRSTGSSTSTVTVYNTHDTVALSGSFAFEPRSEHSMPFEVQLPLNARLSTSSTGWQLAVELDVPGGVDPRGGCRLEVYPSEELLAVVDGIEQGLRFREETERRRWSRANESTYFRFAPPKILESELDYLAMELRQVRGGVSGVLIFDLQEKSLADYFRCAVNMDKEKREFSITLGQIFDEDGEVHVPGIAQVIGEIMQEVIERRS